MPGATSAPPIRSRPRPAPAAEATVGRQPASRAARPSSSRSRRAVPGSRSRPGWRRRRRRPRPGRPPRRRQGCRCADPAPGPRPRAGAASATPGRATRAPTPFGPPNLWADSETRSAAAVRSARSSQVSRPARRRCAARAPGARRRTTSATSSSRLDGADLVVHQQHRHQSDRRGPSASRQRLEVDAAPSGRRDQAAAHLHHGLEHGVVLDGAGHDRPPGAAAGARAGAHGAQNGQVVGLGAAAGEDDVAGPAPTSSASASRASSRARRARPGLPWAPEGLPQRSVSQGSMASNAAGRSGVLAAWSR